MLVYCTASQKQAIILLKNADFKSVSQTTS